MAGRCHEEERASERGGETTYSLVYEESKRGFGRVMVRDDEEYESAGTSSSSSMSMRSNMNAEEYYYDDLRRAKADRVEVVEAMGHDRRVVGAALAAVLRRIDALEEKAAWSEEQREDVDGLVDLVHRVIGYIERLDAAVDELRSGGTSPTAPTTQAHLQYADEQKITTASATAAAAAATHDDHGIFAAATTMCSPRPKHRIASMTTTAAPAVADDDDDHDDEDPGTDHARLSQLTASRIAFARSRACVRASRLLHTSSKLDSSVVIRRHAHI